MKKFYKIKLFIVNLWLNILNFILNLLVKILFKKKYNPKKILVYKVGNIGDIICIIPSLIAIRKFYKEAEITFLTSPGKKNSVGAKDFLDKSWYFDKIINYYNEDINNLSGIYDLIKTLRSKKYDLFIQLPDDWVKFRTLLRNILFAKFIGVKSAFGFYLRTSWLFRKEQILYSPLYMNEVESNLSLLRKNGISIDNIQFDFPFYKNELDYIERLFNDFLKNKENNFIVGINPGAKFSSKEWPIDRFVNIIIYLFEKYFINKFVIFGGPNDIDKANYIINNFRNIKNINILDLTNKTSIKESILALKNINFLISNDTGAVHMAAAVNVPTISLYSIRSPLGKWFPYGNNHIILYCRNINCKNYNSEECIKKSMENISVDEVKKACDKMISNLLKNNI